MKPFARFDIVAVAVMVVAVVALIVRPSFGVTEEPPTPAVSPSPIATTVRVPTTIPDGPIYPEPLFLQASTDTLRVIDPGPHVIQWRNGQVRLTTTAGWLSTNAGTTMVKEPPDTYRWSIQVHDVDHLVADVCKGTGSFAVGRTVDDLTTALESQVGIRRSAPVDVVIDGYPAKKVVLDLVDNHGCPGSDLRIIWANDGSVSTRVSQDSFFSMTWGGTAAVYIVDVNGERLVLTTHHKPASAGQFAELDAIIASIEIRPFQEWLEFGRHSLTVDGVPLSIRVPALQTPVGWHRYGDLYISKDTRKSQAAEAAIYWAAYPDADLADPCGALAGLSIDSSVADLAVAVSTAPGTERVAGPLDVTVGGRPAKYVELIVRDDLGCDPGFFYSWQPAPGGPFWRQTSADDTVRAWVVDVDGTRLFIVGETTPDAGPVLDQEIRDIVDSIQFEKATRS